MRANDESAGRGGLPDRTTVLRSGVAVSGLHLDDLWTNCIALDGSLSLTDLREGLEGRHAFTDHQYNVVAQALNDRLVDLDLDHLVPYADDV